MTPSLPLFPDLDLGERLASNGGCAKPIGRRGGRSRRPGRTTPKATAVLLAELRVLLKSELGDVALQLRKVERAITEHGEDLADMRESVAGVLRHQLAIAREVGAVEQPVTPRVSRRRPLQT